MSLIPGYKINEKVHEGLHFIVYRGIRLRDQEAVILKLLKGDFPLPEAKAALRHEFEITKMLQMSGIVKVFGLEKVHHSMMIVMEDFGAVSIGRYMEHHKLDMETFLRLAISITDTLGHIHFKNVMHKDINPSNIVWNPETDVIKIIDFGFASTLSREFQEELKANILQGTIHYISPEQTGRMNRAMDYRTDIYSLGASFYRMLTGQVPFPFEDAMEVIHGHLAQQPKWPHQLNPEVPEMVSRIILKMMEKVADHRYQSTYGLKRDLQTCLRGLQKGEPIEPFSLAKHDVSDKFQIPQKLYGREHQLNELMEAFKRVSTGSREVALVTGYPGIGKSALVNEIQKPILQKRGFFIRGKFDPLERDIPYSSVIQAFKMLVDQILTQSSEDTAAWRERWEKELGPNGKIIADVIPTIMHIIGPQPEVPELPAGESLRRFQHVFKSFVRSITAGGQPLVIFMDDLQWADLASLHLIELIISDTDLKHVLMVGAFRDREIHEEHPLEQLIDNLNAQNVSLLKLQLEPLSSKDIHELLADTLRTDPGSVEPLASICLDKTAGNPFFLNQYLKSLFENRWISFDASRGKWLWDIDKIEETPITDNVVSFLAERIEKLQPKAAAVIKAASAIGIRFDLSTLAAAMATTTYEVAQDLWEPLLDGLIVPYGEDYKGVHKEEPKKATPRYRFTHDRIHQAAYSLIDKQQLAKLHLRVGRHLLNHMPMTMLEENIFIVTGNLNQGISLIDDPIERLSLAQLNHTAGKRALASAAYEAASLHFETGLTLLPNDAWQTEHELSLDMHVLAAEAAYLCLRFERMEELCQLALKKAGDSLERGQIYKVQILAHIAHSQQSEAVKVGLKALADLGLKVSAAPSKRHLLQGLWRAKLLYFGKDIPELTKLPQMTDPRALMLMDLLIAITPAALFSNPILAVLLAMERDRLSVKYGACPASSPSFASYGSTLCGLTKDINNGYRFGQLASNLLERYDSPIYRGRTLFIMNANIAHWKDPLGRTLRPLREAFQYSVDNGDMVIAALSLMVYHHHSFWMGRDLQKLEKEILNARKRVISLQQQIVVTYLDRNLEAVRLLRRVVNHPKKLSEQLDKIAKRQDPEDPVALCASHTYALYLNYHFGRHQQADRHAQRALSTMTGVSDTYFAAIIVFYYLLNSVQLMDEMNKSTRKRAIKQLKPHRHMLKRWAEACPANHRHKSLLVEAEFARVEGRDYAARDAYEQAMASADRNGFINEEALALELTGNYFHQRQQPLLSKFYLEKAYRAYLQWGADAKAQVLEQKHPECFEQTQVEMAYNLSSSVSLGFSTKSTTTSTLDLQSVFKACQAISGEINLDRLCETLMQIVLENAGAQKGSLLLMRRQQMSMMATASVNEDRKGIIVARPTQENATKQRDWNLPTSIINYVQRTRQAVVLSDATNEAMFTEDHYIRHYNPKSVVCIPLVHQNALAGILYLENRLTTGAFTPDRLEILAILSGQAAIALQNADLYEDLEAANQTLEERVRERTQELEIKNKELKTINDEMVKTQNQMVMQEKMASMGTLTAGIAHEIRNPLNFVNNFADSTREMAQELLEELDRYHKEPSEENLVYLNELVEDLSKNAGIIHNHGQRATQIVNSMMSLARGEKSEKERTDLNRLVDEFATLAYHGRKNHHRGSRAVLDKKLNAELPHIPLIAQSLSRVIINMVNNAMDALMDKQSRLQASDYQPRLTISTADMGDHACIIFRDNGKGIPADKREDIFTPFFTTKPTGTGNIGLGLALSYDIVVQQHSGKLEVDSEENLYTEFRVLLPKSESKPKQTKQTKAEAPVSP